MTMMEYSLSHSPVTRCSSRACRPGEGNPRVSHDRNPFALPPHPPSFLTSPPHSPSSPVYAPLVSLGRELARSHEASHSHRLLFLCAADFDFRLLASNWLAALHRKGATNALVYALDSDTHEYLRSQGHQSVDGSSNLAGWNATRLSRHIQRAEAERHLAAAALAWAGLDVLLTETTHVMVGDVRPMLRALASAGGDEGMDMAVPKGLCKGQVSASTPTAATSHTSRALRSFYSR